MGWNGLDLVNDFSSELGDVSPAFKTKVLRWINEGIRDIATAHTWPFLRRLGQIVLNPGTESQKLPLHKPAAPSISLTPGGTLTPDVKYQALITFYEGAAEVESIAGHPATVTPTGTDLSIELSSIPISSSGLVTERRVYVSKAGGAFQFHGSIPNNLIATPGADPDVDPPIPVTYSINIDPSSPVTAPDENQIYMIDGDVGLDDGSFLTGGSLQDLRYLHGGKPRSGSPQAWALMSHEEIILHPMPISTRVMSFYYFKLPAKVFGTTSSTPQLPSWLYEDLRRYVIWRGYEYRDRAGKESKQANYENGLRLTISRRGKSIKRSGRVRSVTADSDGVIS